MSLCFWVSDFPLSVQKKRKKRKKKIGFPAVSHFKRGEMGEKQGSASGDGIDGVGRGWCRVGMYLKARQRDQKERETKRRNRVCP